MENRVVYLTEREVSESLKLSMSRLRQMRCKGQGPAFVKLPSGGVRYRPDDVRDWAEGIDREAC